jgi:hypothetical protein
MAWLKRCFWLSAWGVWLWLGVGLARELPRDLGPVLCKLLLEDGEYLCGFLNDGTAVSRLAESGENASRYQTWDVATGRRINDWNGPTSGSPWWDLLRLGFVAGENDKAYKAKGEPKPFQLLDLRTGSWMPLGSTFLRLPYEHPIKPWLVLEDTSGGELAVHVFDVEAKRWLFEWRRERPKHRSDESFGEAWFEGDNLVIVFEVVKRNKEGRSIYWNLERQWLERWHVPTKKLIESVVIDPPGVIVEKPGPSGRMIVAGRNGRRKATAVVDASTLKTVFSSDDPDQGEVSWQESSVARIPTQRLSASGRMLLSDIGRLWDIERNRIVWQVQQETESIDDHQHSPTAFRVFENWKPLLEKVHSRYELTTVAVRDMETGAVQYRTFDGANFSTASPNGTILYSSSGVIYGSLPPVKWRLLAICQTILALPLVLLWAMLRWRRKRLRRTAAG